VTKPVALVTGASGGIGEAIARQLAARGEDVVLVARSADRLASIASSISAASGRAVAHHALDLADRDAAERLGARLRQDGIHVRHLVNNAGYGLAGDVADLPREGQLGIIDLNCRALTDLTLTFLPDVLSSKGGILNVASVAAFTPGPGLAVYYASKSFVVSFTRALAYELAGRGALVCALCPGPTPTGFGKRAGFRLTGAMALTGRLSAADVAQIGLAGYFAGRTIVVPGARNRVLTGLLGIVPTALVLPVLDRAQRGRRDKPPGLP
jgi:short-subunit dehydrogenase